MRNKILFLLIASVLAVGCLQQQAQQPQPSATPTPTISVLPSPTPQVQGLSINVTVNAPARNYFYSKILQAQKGETALKVFSDAGVEMGIKNYSFGIYVFSVQNINESNDEQLYWQYYFNGVLAPVGASDFRVSENGILEWRLESPQMSLSDSPNASN